MVDTTLPQQALIERVGRICRQDERLVGARYIVQRRT